MEVLVICLVAFAASWLTLISGFGLGTLLLPVFILFFDLIEAMAMTAVVHFFNNIFKFGLLYRQIDRQVLLWFGVSGIFGAALGAWLSTGISDMTIYEAPFSAGEPVQMLSVVVGVLMILFAFQELVFGKMGFRFSRKSLVPGGVLSGFFGGLTGHQGALRTMFLLKSGLTPHAYIATGTAIALLVDMTRIPLYLRKIADGNLSEEWGTLLLATLSAFVGAMIGKRMIPKVTLRTVQWIVGILMIGIGFGLLAGIL